MLRALTPLPAVCVCFFFFGGGSIPHTPISFKAPATEAKKSHFRPGDRGRPNVPILSCQNLLLSRVNCTGPFVGNSSGSISLPVFKDKGPFVSFSPSLSRFTGKPSHPREHQSTQTATFYFIFAHNENNQLTKQFQNY